MTEELKQLTRVDLKNLDKILYPETNVSKGQVIEYYVRMAPKMLPIIKDRPLVLTRYPDGINGENCGFFEKDAPLGTPEWIKTKTIYSPSSRRDIHYVICDDLDTLVWLANLAALEIHMPFSTIMDLDKPDMLFLDIDPEPPATISDAAQVALLVKDKLDDVGLKPFVKTSGKKGLHIVVPIVPEHTFEETRVFVHKIGIDLAKGSEIIVSEFKDTKTPGKVFVDYMENAPMRTMVAPYSLRPTAQATVSTPLDWNEVKKGIRPSDFNIFSVVKRKENPWRNIFEKRFKLEV
ncbi:MAG TPA: non-homologous end-joining DNA ligase [Candidatus Limnocylindrales bacterium]|nr:non-homologous end-joining DNA ligase [Candidatus Limnocylindrales bacterium]